MRSEKLATNIVITKRFEGGILNLAGDLLQRGYKIYDILMHERSESCVINGRRVSLYREGKFVKRDDRTCQLIFEMISHNGFLMSDIKGRHTMLVMSAMTSTVVLRGRVIFESTHMGIQHGNVT